MLPSGFFPDVPGAERSERIGVERIWKAIHSGDPEAVRDTCIAVQRERGELVVSHLQALGVFATLVRNGKEARRGHARR